MPTEREGITAALSEYEAQYLPLSDGDIQAEMLKWKVHTPGYRAGERILKDRETERDPTRKVIADLAARVENIERTATTNEFKKWSTWIAIAALLVSLVTLAAMIALSS